MSAATAPAGPRAARWWERGIAERYRPGIARGALQLGGGTLAVQVLKIATAPVIARLYDPSAVGLLGLVVAFVTFASVAVSLRYDFAIVTAVDEREAGVLLLASLTLTLAVAGLMAGVLAVLIRNRVLSYGALPTWSVAAAFGMLVLMGASSALRYWHVRKGAFAHISWALVAQGSARSVVTIGAGLLGAGWGGLLGGEIVGRFLGVVGMLSGAWSAVATAARDGRAAVCRALVRNRKYPQIVLPSSLLDSAAAMLPVPITVALFGTQHGGEFFLVQSVLGLPTALIAGSAADVLHAQLATAFLQRPRGVRTLVRRALLHLLAVGTVIYVPVALLAPWIAGPVLGARWAGAGLIATFLVPQMLTALLAGPPSRLLLVVSRPEWKLAADLLKLVVPPALLYTGDALHLGFRGSILLFGLAGAASNCVYLAIIWHAARLAPVLSRARHVR